MDHYTEYEYLFYREQRLLSSSLAWTGPYILSKRKNPNPFDEFQIFEELIQTGSQIDSQKCLSKYIIQE